MFGSRLRGKKNNQDRAARIQEDRKYLLSQKQNFFLQEAYKTLRTNVMFSLTVESECKVIAVTSSLQSEGKSTTATNLALSFVAADKKVIIIDCDLRRPKLARLLGVNAPYGLSNILIEPALLKNSIVKFENTGLDVLLSGDIPPNPSELLGSERMGKLINALRSKYDYIILDTPPVNMVTDAVMLSEKTDGIIFVVRAFVSEKGDVMRAIEQLKYAKAKVLGFVLNGSSTEVGRYGRKYGYGKYKKYGYRYGYKYGYGYGYGYTSEKSEKSSKSESE